MFRVNNSLCRKKLKALVWSSVVGRTQTWLTLFDIMGKGVGCRMGLSADKNAVSKMAGLNINLFVLNTSFLYPLKTSENCKVF